MLAATLINPHAALGPSTRDKPSQGLAAQGSTTPVVAVILMFASTAIGTRPCGSHALPCDARVVGLTSAVVQSQLFAADRVAEGEPEHVLPAARPPT